MRSPAQLLGILAISATLIATTALPLINARPAAAQSLWERLFQRRRDPNRQASGRTRGGAVRDELCSAEAADKSLVAIVPQSNLGDTVDSHPSFFFYVPFSSSENTDLVAEFMLITDDRQYWLEEPLLVALPQSPGIVRLDLPESLPGLEVGDRYNWYFSILCENWELSRNPFVSGWVERVGVENAESANPRDAVDTWHETLHFLTQQLPGDRDTWEAFLGTYDLEEFSGQPIEEMTPLQLIRGE